MGMNEARELLSSRTGPRALSFDGSIGDPHVAGVANCVECGGSGHEPLSGRKHAAAIGADWSAYSRFWRPVYEWMLCGFCAAEERAARKFNSALSKAA